MELLLRVEGGGDARDVRVDLDASHTVGQLAQALAGHLGVGGGGKAPPLVRVRSGEVLPAAEPVERCGLLSGETTVLGGDGRRRDGEAGAEAARRPVATGIVLDVVAGPDAGRSHSLAAGRNTVGRDTGCDVTLYDPTVSSVHVSLDLAGDGSVTLTAEPAATNAARLDGDPVSTPRRLQIGSVVQIGASAVTLRRHVDLGDAPRDQLGQVPFHRTPHRPVTPKPRTFDALGDVPTWPEPQRFAYLSAVLPLVAGIGMAVILGDARFLFLTALAPISVVSNHVEQRRQRGRRYEAALRRFRARADERRRALHEALEDERARRLDRSPDVADLARRAALRGPDLWRRSRQHPDFLELRLGLGDVASSVTAQPEQSGDDDLRDEVRAVVDEVAVLRDVPVPVSLTDLGVVAAWGEDGDVGALIDSLAVQAACLHSPEDLIIAAALAPERRSSEWLKWLPHTRSATSPLAGAHLAVDREDADRLLREVVEVADLRASSPDRSIDRRWPWLLLLLDDALHPDAALVSQALDRCPAAGISVVWLAGGLAHIPRQAKAVVRCQPLRTGELSSLWLVDPDLEPRQLDIERAHESVTDVVGQALAPLRDASVASATTAIPRVVPLFSALGTEELTTRWVIEQWLVDRGRSLAAPIGMTTDGPFVLDLVEHGPHALIGGTSGAGKSELLQSIVASLIAYHTPARLNLLFVDYKGGASSTVFRPVPHTVGYVTNLDARLSLRALTSLRAELDRRMRLLEGRAKDLAEMLDKHPDEAPPSLVIVVDEFATLVREVPDFVAGIVDIAQRGRSLGIHLILATQRPSGSVNDNILANTNLRIALRMLDSAESTSVVGAPDAAEIPVPLRGRALARLGPRELVELQSAYSGAPVTAHDGVAPITVESFTPGGAGAATTGGREAAAPGTPSRTQLDVVIEAVVGAAAQLELPPGRQPWLEVLPEHLPLDEVRDDARLAGVLDQPGRRVVIGMVDDPAAQDQHPAVVDLEDGGGLLVFGTGGSGKTSVLRTLAVSAAADDAAAGGGRLVVFGLDFSSRALQVLRALPQCAAVATGDDLEATSRVIAHLTAELARRRTALAAADADGDPGRGLPRVLLLVDGYANLFATLSSNAGQGRSLHEWLEAFHQLVVDGRQVGIHTVITADRRGAVPGQLLSAVANRLVLRQVDEAGMVELGVPTALARGEDLNAGRAVLNGARLVQVASVASSPEEGEQAATRRVAATLSGVVPPSLETRPLPDVVPLVYADLPPLHAIVGAADLTLAPVEVALGHGQLVVIGPGGSGRSTALAVVALQLALAGSEVWAVGPGDSRLVDLLENATRQAFGAASEVLPVLDELALLLEYPPTGVSRVLVFDDVDLVDDPALHLLLGRLVRAAGLRMITSAEVRSFASFSANPLLAEMKKTRQLLYLRPDTPMDVQTLVGVRPPMRPGLRMPRGRGVLVTDREPRVVQVSTIPPND